MAFTVTKLIEALVAFRDTHGDLAVMLGTEEGYASAETVETSGLLGEQQCAICVWDAEEGSPARG